MCIVHTIECHHSSPSVRFQLKAWWQRFCPLLHAVTTVPLLTQCHDPNNQTKQIYLYISQICMFRLFFNSTTQVCQNASANIWCPYRSIFRSVVAAVSRLVNTDIVLEKIRFAPSAHVWELSGQQGWRQCQRCICHTTNAACLYHHLRAQLYKTGCNLYTNNLEFWYGE